MASSREPNCWPFRSSSRTRPFNDSIQAFCHVLPGVDEGGAGAVEAAPVGDGVGDELGPVVEAPGRSAALGGQVFEAGHHALRVVGASDVDGECFAAVLVDDVKQFEHPAVRCLVELEVECPHHTRADRAEAAHDQGLCPAAASCACDRAYVGHLPTQKRRIRLLVTSQPAWRAVLAASSPSGAAEQRSRAKGRAGRALRMALGGKTVVERGWPTTRQAQRSETSNRTLSVTTAARRRSGVRGFPHQLLEHVERPSGSADVVSRLLAGCDGTA